MNILNIHGYQGTPQNAACSALQALGCNVISPAIDYDSVSPQELLQTLRQTVREQKTGMLAGTSYGGFYAAVLSAELHLPVILVNPCLLPFLHLPRLGFQQDILPLIPLFGSLSGIDRNIVRCIIGADDEIIDTHDFTQNLLGSEHCRIVPGGKHSGATLPLEAYLREVLPGMIAETAAF